MVTNRRRFALSLPLRLSLDNMTKSVIKRYRRRFDIDELTVKPAAPRASSHIHKHIPALNNSNTFSATTTHRQIISKHLNALNKHHNRETDQILGATHLSDTFFNSPFRALTPFSVATSATQLAPDRGVYVNN